MWEGFTAVLQEGGVVAALFFLMLVGAGFFFKALWKQNQELHGQIAALQEKRLEDALKMHGKMVEHTDAIDQAMGRLSTSLDVLIRMSGRE